MINIVSRSPYDDFTVDLFQQLLSSIDSEFEAYYLWSNPPWLLDQFFRNTKFTQPNVVIGIKDSLDQWRPYDFWQDRAQVGVQLLDKIAGLNPDRNFVIFTSLENIQAEEITSKNIQFICWGGDITNQANLYPTVCPVLNKNFDSEQTYISLNRNCREHREVALSYLYGRGYDSAGQITFLGIGDSLKQKTGTGQLSEHLSWDFDSMQADFFVDNREVIRDGYLKVCVDKSNVDQGNIEENKDVYKAPNDNFTNFNLNLRPKYQHSFVEIVSESSFVAPGYNVTEKTLNSIYACNFPIILGGVGIVQLLRDIGVDVFDDVIDHSYDLITNPFNRIINAIECNKQLLLDADYAKEQWVKNKHRFESNVDRARTQLYPWYRNRAIAQFNQLNWIG